MKNLHTSTASSNDVSDSLRPVLHPGASRAPLGVLLLGAVLSTGCGEPGTSLQARPMDAKGQGLTSLAATCQEIRTADPSAIDGEYTLYIGGDAKKPWTAWCYDMAGTPREYLSLMSGTNYSQYTVGGYTSGSSVRTYYAKVRIDPVTLRVFVADQTFAQSLGSLNHGGTLVTSMPYGVAMSCDNKASGVASIDLTGTPFAVAPHDFSVQGANGVGTIDYRAEGRGVKLTGGGYCGWTSWTPAYSPFNQTGSDPLHLQYRAPPVLAATCQEIRTAHPTAMDGEYTLHVGGDQKKPWTAWCHDMAGTPREYLSLVSGTNYSQYTAGGSAMGQNVRTDYAKVRIDPVTLRVSVADQTFARSTGSLEHGGTLVTSMPYGVAMSCDSTASGVASIDLTGTPFAVTPHDFSLGGTSPVGTTTYGTQGRRVDLTGGGDCGWNSGDPLHLEYRDAPVCMGQTAPGAYWQQYTFDSVALDVDTSSCGFSETPMYFASIGGTGYHWQTTGATSIISPTATGFRVIVRSPSSVTPAFASQYGWHLNWQAMPDRVRQPSLCTGQTTPGATNWQPYGAEGLSLDVDTTACGYSAAPLYFTSVGGLDGHWKTTGATSIYLPTATGFRVYVWHRGNSLTPALANGLGWHLNWRAQPDGLRQSWNCTGRTPQGSTSWQQYTSDSLYVDVSTSGCAASGAPITSIGGTGDQWGLMGATSIYSPTPTGFRIYVRYPGSNLTPSLANQRGWHLNWNRR